MMDVTQFTLILVAMFLLSVLLLGGGIAMYMGQRKKESERIAEEKKAILAEPLPETDREKKQTVQPAPSPVKDSNPADQEELLRVLRHSPGGGLTVQVQGKTADRVTDMDANRRAELRRALEELVRWLETEESPADAHEPVVEVKETETPETGYFADTLPERVELKDVIPFRKKNIPKLKEAPPPPKSIVAQIDEILQELLPRSSLQGKAIRLTEEPGGGLLIHAGERNYQGIDEVDDAEIKALIKRAVREWNEKNRLQPGSTSH